MRKFSIGGPTLSRVGDQLGLWLGLGLGLGLVLGLGLGLGLWLGLGLGLGLGLVSTLSREAVFGSLDQPLQVTSGIMHHIVSLIVLFVDLGTSPNEIH